MKRIIKISFVILIISSFLLAQNTQSVFNVRVGDQVKYKMLDSEISVEFGSLAESFPGFLVNNTLIDIGTSFKLNIEEITATDLDWNSTIGSNTMYGTCPSDTNAVYADIGMFLAGYELMMLYDVMTIYSSGEIDAEHLDPFFFPPFVDTAPITWTMFETVVNDQATLLSSIFMMVPEINNEATFSDANDTMSVWWYFDFTWQVTPSPLMEVTIMYDLTFSYDMFTGILQEVVLDFQYNGTMDTSEFIVEMDQHLIQSDQSDFVEFLDENKWYFVGGGGGLIALIVGFAIIIRVIKRR